MCVNDAGAIRERRAGQWREAGVSAGQRGGTGFAAAGGSGPGTSWRCCARRHPAGGRAALRAVRAKSTQQRRARGCSASFVAVVMLGEDEPPGPAVTTRGGESWMRARNVAPSRTRRCCREGRAACGRGRDRRWSPSAGFGACRWRPLCTSLSPSRTFMTLVIDASAGARPAP